MSMTTCLWFDKQGEEAANFYVKLFTEAGRKAKLKTTAYFSESAANASGQPKGSVMTVTFDLDGQQFMALNGGPHYKISPAISFIINCETQDEIDFFWKKFGEGGEEVQCGWINDKFGVSWQVVPNILGELMSSPDRAKAGAAMQAMLKMKKLDIAALKKAYETA